jgi:hypothetical protein
MGVDLLFYHMQGLSILDFMHSLIPVSLVVNLVIFTDVVEDATSQNNMIDIFKKEVIFLQNTAHDRFIQWLSQIRFFSQEICRNLRAQAPTYIRLILIGQCEITRISCHFCRPFVVQNQSHTVEYHNTWHVNILALTFSNSWASRLQSTSRHAKHDPSTGAVEA